MKNVFQNSENIPVITVNTGTARGDSTVWAQQHGGGGGGRETGIKNQLVKG